MRWYCWLIFFAIASLSTWAFPSDDVDEKNLLTLGNENEQTEGTIVEDRLLNEEDDDDDEGVDEDGFLAITDRHLRRRKPQKYNKDDSDESDEKEKKKPTKKKCVCFGKKPNRKHPHRPGNERIEDS